jgi:hypothetical protein
LYVPAAALLTVQAAVAVALPVPVGVRVTGLVFEQAVPPGAPGNVHVTVPVGVTPLTPVTVSVNVKLVPFAAVVEGVEVSEVDDNLVLTVTLAWFPDIPR